MKRNLSTFVASIVVTTVFAFSNTFAQGILPNSFGGGFFGDVSVKIYCTFSNFVPGSDTSACKSNILVTDQSENATTTLTTAKFNQISGVINKSLTSGANIVYVPGPRGQDGKNGTTTVIYQTIAGALGASPAAYIYAGGNTNSNPYQTTVPGDIYSTFIHFLTSEKITTSDLISTNAAIDNIVATNTFSINLAATNATLTNLVSTKATIAGATIGDSTTTNSTTTNLFATNASITNSTSTTLYSLISNLINLISTNATITNATTTNLFASNASITNATTTNLFSTKASITEATTTYFFSTWANFLNMFVENLSFKNATGTNLQVANASTTNLVATGTTRISELYVASSTQINSNILSGYATLTAASISSSTIANATIQNAQIIAGNATLTNAKVTNLNADNTVGILATFTSATSTNLFATNASLTNATTTNLFTALLNAISATFTNLLATNATITNATTTNFFASNANIFNLLNTNATLTNATITNLRVVNCAEGNVLCNGGNDTGAIVGVDAPLVVGTLNAGNINFITGDAGAPSVTPGAVKLVIETGLPAEGSGAVRVTNSLKVGGNIVASGTVTTTNLNATGTFVLATGTIASTTVNWLTAVRGLITNATITNSTSTNIFANNASLTNATSTNLFANLFSSLNAKIDSLVTTNATFTNATSTNLSVTNALSALTAVFTNLIATNATTTNFATANLVATGTFSLATGTIASTSISNLSANNATVTYSLFSRVFNFLNATGTDLRATGTSNLANIVSASSTLAGTNITSGNAVFTRATTTNATTTSLYVGGLAVFSDDVKINNQLNVDAGTLFVDDINEAVGINTLTPITTGDVRLTVSGNIRIGTSGFAGCVQNFSGTGLIGTCSSDENLKTNISELNGNDIISKISNLRFVSYNWNDIAKEKYSRNTENKNLGVLAQNVQGLFPELVTTDSEGYKQVNLTDLQWYLFAGLKELNQKVDSITKTFDTLTAKTVTSDKVVMKEFCVGGECFTEGDMKEFRTYLNDKSNLKKETEKETVVVPAVVVPTPEVIAPVVETPTVEAPVAETPIAETSAVETPTTPTPVVETTTEVVPEVTN